MYHSIIILQQDIIQSHINLTCNLPLVKKTIEQFTSTCEIFTTVNAFKYQLLNYLFHNNETISNITKFIGILSHLETAAEILQEIASIEASN